MVTLCSVEFLDIFVFICVIPFVISLRSRRFLFQDITMTIIDNHDYTYRWLLVIGEIRKQAGWFFDEIGGCTGSVDQK